MRHYCIAIVLHSHVWLRKIIIIWMLAASGRLQLSDVLCRDYAGDPIRFLDGCSRYLRTLEL